MCHLGRIELGTRQVQMITLPDCLVHYRMIEAVTAQELDQAINAFEAKVVAAGALVYQVSCLSETPWIYLVIFFHSVDIEVLID